MTDLPIDSIQQSIQLTDDQLKSLNALKAASSQASDALKASCSSELSMTPLGRLDTVQKRLDGMVQAWGMMRTPLDDFYNSLNDEQRQRFAALGPASSARSNRRGSASGDNLAALCSSRTESFTQLPVQRVEQAVKPTQQQQDALEKLKAASTEAANQLQASCPAQSPQTPLDRFDAVGKRLNAMAGAIKTVRPALADFYSSLTDEQKATFNNLGPPQAHVSSGMTSSGGSHHYFLFPIVISPRPEFRDRIFLQGFRDLVLDSSEPETKPNDLPEPSLAVATIGFRLIQF